MIFVLHQSPVVVWLIQPFLPQKPSFPPRMKTLPSPAQPCLFQTPLRPKHSYSKHFEDFGHNFSQTRPEESKRRSGKSAVLDKST